MKTTSNIDKLRNLDAYLRNNIRGQAHVLPRVQSVLKRGELGLAHPNRPKGSFLFVGPTGVGKTEITVCFSDFLFGPGHCHRFDMSEFQNQSSVGLLLGQSETEIGMLGRALAKADRGTLLFDEMEKAHPLVLDLFLQILDAGRITLATGETRSLNGYYIVFTSNIGAAEAMRMEHSALATIERTVLRRVDQTLRPELVARISEKVVFTRLTFQVQREICELMVSREVERLAKMGFHFTIEESALEFLVREGYHRTLGARPMRNAVERHLQDALTETLLAECNTARRIVADRARGRLQFE
ncbi:ATP-dependent Clp protease ATP-binding subunit ClpB [Verrucomicrobium sp. GAS474]|uniref:AAA family ATPase n=1 Tax=Verrucomicrobium sp. GAS474 TaxID=1882831 RepID=UPI00087B14A6|nr:AAA family ATPase [Verrucomicrobium sp. GAS474]SDT90560.1 ATP-dependent Clp protease ATP-binding subunit ClpB [Verrucomicrobium sp. GAS474]